jgi:Transposase DDE domain
MGHALMENRHGLVVGALVTRATGTAEREAALALLDRHRPPRRRITLGTDKAYDVEAFVEDLRGRRVTPHVAINGHQTKTGKRRRTAIDGRTIRHRGYASSQRCRKRIEEAFGWIKAAAGFAGSMPPSRSQPPPTTSCACRSSWPEPCREGLGQSDRRTLAHRRGGPVGP